MEQERPLRKRPFNAVDRPYVEAFIRGLGYGGLDDIVSLRLVPGAIIVRRFLLNADGSHKLDSFGPATAEIYHSLIDPENYEPPGGGVA